MSLGCSQKLKADNKEILEASLPARPDWVDRLETQYEDNQNLYLRSEYTLRGDQRINSCYDLAKLDGAQQLINQISQELKGEYFNVSSSSSENEIEALTKAVRSRFEGELRGLRLLRQYFERYEIKGVERITCYVEHSIEKKNLTTLQRRARDIAQEVRDELTKRQVKFVEKE